MGSTASTQGSLIIASTAAAVGFWLGFVIGFVIGLTIDAWFDRRDVSLFRRRRK